MCLTRNHAFLFWRVANRRKTPAIKFASVGPVNRPPDNRLYSMGTPCFECNIIGAPRHIQSEWKGRCLPGGVYCASGRGGGGGREVGFSSPKALRCKVLFFSSKPAAQRQVATTPGNRAVVKCSAPFKHRQSRSSPSAGWSGFIQNSSGDMLLQSCNLFCKEAPPLMNQLRLRALNFSLIKKISGLRPWSSCLAIFPAV